MSILKKIDTAESILSGIFEGCEIKKCRCFFDIYPKETTCGFTYYKADLSKAAPFGKIRFWGNLEHVGGEIEGLDLFCSYFKCKSDIMSSSIEVNGCIELSGSFDRSKFVSPFIKCGITPAFSSCVINTKSLRAETHIINNLSKIKTDELCTKTLRCSDTLREIRDGKELMKCVMMYGKCKPERIIIQEQNYNKLVFMNKKINCDFRTSDGYWLDDNKTSHRIIQMGIVRLWES